MGATGLKMVRLRRNVTITVLANCFRISVSCASRIIVNWILFSMKELEFLVDFQAVIRVEWYHIF